jgi:hypothetical protein
MNHGNRVPEPDARLIELQKPDELIFWTKVFNVSQQALIGAVVAVGHRAQDVKSYLEAKEARESVQNASASTAFLHTTRNRSQA